MSFSKILIANRGEIACRVMRTARTLGYRTVAVFSEADRHAPHVALADEAVCIGPAPAADSYLRIDALLDAARRTGANAVHPGYGFLSERADFARACREAGLVFIGPSPESIDAMGHKAGAKQRMLAAGVPCVPGYLALDEPDAQRDARLAAEAERIGYPLLVKAVAGGGGRGMRLVQAPHELPMALAGARREAESAFGDGRLLLERLIERGRHIEIQVFADRHGHAVHLGERDCTTQRRRQKVIEEAPSPVVSPAMREAMGRDAVAAALAVRYEGAGTVEFIVDEDGRHYFLEMNTRLQVEHPVTECITGLDLVEWQLRVAAGEPLPLKQHEIRFEGHAIEARLYAEDAYAGFAPQTGRVAWWRPQLALRPGVRIDDGIREGGEVTPWYDAMVAKLIVHGRDRDDAIRRLAAVLEDAPLVGVTTNARFLRDLLRHADFRAAQLHTATLDAWSAEGVPLLQRPRPEEADWLVAAGLLAQGNEVASAAAVGPLLRPASLAAQAVTVMHGGEQRRWIAQVSGNVVELRAAGAAPGTGSHGVRAAADDRLHRFEWQGNDAEGRLRIALDGVQRCVIALRDTAGALQLARDAAVFRFEEPSPYPADSDARDPARACAPVAGLVAQVLVQPGDAVREGQPLASVEAMKMEMWLTAACAGRVKAVHAKPKDGVAAGALIVELEPQA
jgi:geranyl-CoA carboxylase alpha subunit